MSNPSADLAALALKRAKPGIVLISGVKTSYWQYDSKEAGAPIILFIHGYRGNHHGLEAIAGAMPDFNIIIPDLPGFGESAEFPSEHNIANYSAWMSALIPALKLKSPIVLAHSFGTIVSSAAVAQGADASALILVNPVSAPALKGPRAALSWLTSLTLWFTSVVPENIGNAILRSHLFVRTMSVVMAKTKDAKLRKWIHAQHDTNFNNYESRRVAVEGYMASISHTVAEYAHLISQPTLLIAGDKDDITTVAEQRSVGEKFANAELVVLHKVGHLTHYERPGEIAATVRSFYQKLKQ